ncbi:MAG: MBOAT family protein [Clostridia bacterium]|nr:MBOAT family protein [Clostridia bacterium]
MLFSSLEFLFLFLPLCIAVYFAVPLRLRNAVLLVFSLIFYGFGEPLYLFLMIFTTGADYAFGLLVQKSLPNKRRARAVVAFAVIFNLSILGFFKYYDFLASCISRIEIFSFIKPIGLPLPVGISFYTFQALSYVIDVYREEVRAAKDPIIPATYVALFPQLVAGPIIRYNDIEGALRERSHSFTRAAEGIRRFCVGLAKKVILANTAGEIWQSFAMGFDAASADIAGGWLGLVCYAFQIYFDFSGYSDMAVGLGKIFGFDFPENFNYPYISRSITEFWRRWHITLSSYFREYVYIPLGGNRRGRARTYLNLLIVWSLTGIWHGAGANFLLWGLYYFALLCLEKAFLLKLLDRVPKIFRHIYSLFFILIGWLIFAADGAEGSLSLYRAAECIGILLGFGKAPLISPSTLYEIVRNLIPLAIMAFASLPFAREAVQKLARSERFGGVTNLLLNLLTLPLLVLCVAYLVNSGYNPFLYFRF